VIKLNQKQKEELERCAKASNDKDEIRKSQTILLLDEKNGLKLVKRLIGYGRTQAYTIKKRYLKEGIPSLSDKRKGKPKELLTKQQREEIIETVKTKRPKDCGYEREHWITSILGDWISRNFKVKYKSKTSLYLVFKQAQFTYHKPGRVYDKHDEKEVEAWKAETKPKLDRYLKEENAVLLAEDEMVLTTETTIQKVWLPEGEFPKIICTTGGRKRRSVYGFLNMKTGEEHAFKTEFQNMYQTKDILEEIRNIYPKQKIVLFWDNAGWHRGSVVQDWIRNDGNIEIIHFPRYAPEENPQEHVWKSGREKVTHNEYIENIDVATDTLVEYFKRTRFGYSLLGVSSVS
jgi:transposase